MLTSTVAMSEQVKPSSPSSTRTSRGNLPSSMSSVADVAAPEAPNYDSAAMGKALKKCLQSSSFYGRIADTETVVEDAIIFHNCMPAFAQFQRVVFVWNSDVDLDSQTNADTKSAFTMLMQDPHSQCCGAAIWWSSCNSV